MNTDKFSEYEGRFVREWREWLDRPARQSPAVAAARVSDLVSHSRKRSRPVWALATAGATLAVLAVICLFPRRISTELPVPGGPLVVTPEAAQPGEVLIWLDEDTPLYMHFQPPASQGGNKS